MFWPSVVELKQFYSSPLGQAACALVQKRILALWPDAKDDTIAGIGYTTPYLRAYHGKSMLNIAFMPAAQGALYWPATGNNLTALVDEGQLPLHDNLVNRVLMVHSLENTEQLRAMLEEAWRILTPGGKLLVVVPNRNGAWARAAHSPFASGHPYSSSQLKKLFADTQFTTTRSASALFLPPYNIHFLMRIAEAIEAVGTRICAGFGGVLLMEAEKQIYASTKDALLAKSIRRGYTPAPRPVMTRDTL